MDFETSKESGIHQQLTRLAGTWNGLATTWFGPGTIADQSPVEGTIKPVLDGRFMLHEYKGSFQGKPLEGIAVYGFHLGLGKIQSAWIDTFHNGTALMFSEGEEGSETLNMLGGYDYVTPEERQKWGWRTEIDIINENEIRITAYNITPAGEATKATETIYKRI